MSNLTEADLGGADSGGADSGGAANRESGKSHGGAAQAVALSYDKSLTDSAPVVTASGQGHLARRIIEEAEKHGVTIHQDEDLVSLLAATEIGQEIPVEAFVAVAEILRYIYQKNGE